MNEHIPRELTTEEVAEALGVSERTIYTLREEGRLVGRQDGAGRAPWLYTLESVKAELMRRKGLA